MIIVSHNRGLLLYRIRNELRNTLRQYQSLYQSATSYGIRKALQGEAWKDVLEKAIYKKGGEIEELKKQVEEAKQELDIARHRALDKREALMQSREIDIARMKELNEGVKVSTP